MAYCAPIFTTVNSVTRTAMWSSTIKFAIWRIRAYFSCGDAQNHRHPLIYEKMGGDELLRDDGFFAAFGIADEVPTILSRTVPLRHRRKPSPPSGCMWTLLSVALHSISQIRISRVLASGIKLSAKVSLWVATEK